MSPLHPLRRLPTTVILRCLAISLVVCSVSALASDPVAPAVNAPDKEAFATVSTWVRAQMDGGGRYSYVTAGERRQVNSGLDSMGVLMEKNGSVDKMSDADKRKMLGYQDQVNSLLAKRDNDRLVCSMQNPIGSNIPVKTCRTAGEIEAERRHDTEYAFRRQATPQLRGGN